MSRWPATAGIAVLALLHPAVLLVPAIVLAGTADKGAVPGAHGRALFAASALLGAAHGILTWYRLRRQRHRGVHQRVAVIATFDGLVVLALLSTLLLFVALGAYAPLGIVLVNRGWPVLIPWITAQGVAVLLAEGTRRVVLAWLTAARGDG